MIANILPPPFIEKFNYRSCKQVNDSVTHKRVYVTPDGESVPSVTTILSATKDTTHLDAWRTRVGVEKAKQITTEAAGVGTAMHGNIERFLVGIERMPGNNPVHVKGNAMADLIISNGLSQVTEIWGIEQSLWYPGLYSGTTDLVGCYQGRPAIMDFKQTNKPKKIEWVEDYFLQLCLYGMAHNVVYGTNICEGHIFMCSRGTDPILPGGEEFQHFEVTHNDWDFWCNKALERVSQFYGI